MRRNACTHVGIVVGGEDELLGGIEAAGILPGAGLPVNIEARNVAAHQAALAVCIDNPIDGLHVAPRRGDEFADQVDIPLVLDRVFADPGGLVVRLRHHGERALGCHEAVAPGLVGVVRNILPLRPPLVGPHAARFQKAGLALQGIVEISRAGSGLVQHHPGDRIQTVAVEKSWSLEIPPSYLSR